MHSLLQPKMRRVEYLVFSRILDDAGKYLRTDKVFGGVAVFHQFGLDYPQFDECAATFSTAILELPDGTILNHPVELVKFIDPLDPKVVFGIN